jgi:cysteine desulfurase
VDPRVAQKMSHCLMTEGNFGNPASRSHVFGWRADEAVEEAREQVAQLLHCDPREIVWTSGATESDNLALKGVTEYYGAGRRHIVTSAIEHKAVLDTCKYLEGKGFSVSYLVPNGDGIITPDAVRAAIRSDTLIASIMHANNEIGVVNDIAAIGAVCREHKVFYHVDAAQSAGKLAIDLTQLPVDLMSLSGHKMYGPKGIGVLYVRRDPAVHLVPQMHGGGHERGMRSGTLPTHQIVGMGEAARLLGEVMTTENSRIRALRESLWTQLSVLPGVRMNGASEQRLAGNLNVSFEGVDGETLLMALDDVAVSSGSACTSATVEPSYVLRALGLSDDLAHASIRFTVGRFTTAAEIDYAARRVIEVVRKLRERHAA